MRMLLDAEIADLVGNASAINTEQQLVMVAQRLVYRARDIGLVLTVEQRPLQPLAMGNYCTEVRVRAARASNLQGRS